MKDEIVPGGPNPETAVFFLTLTTNCLLHGRHGIHRKRQRHGCCLILFPCSSVDPPFELRRSPVNGKEPRARHGPVPFQQSASAVGLGIGPESFAKLIRPADLATGICAPFDQVGCSREVRNVPLQYRRACSDTPRAHNHKHISSARQLVASPDEHRRMPRHSRPRFRQVQSVIRVPEAQAKGCVSCRSGIATARARARARIRGRVLPEP